MYVNPRHIGIMAWLVGAPLAGAVGCGSGGAVGNPSGAGTGGGTSASAAHSSSGATATTGASTTTSTTTGAGAGGEGGASGIGPGGGGGSSPVPKGFGPADLQSAYGLDTLVGTDPAQGTVVGIFVSNGSYPDAFADNTVYRSTFGLPTIHLAPAGTTSCAARPCMATVNTSGATSPLPAPQSAFGEAALDVTMVTAACPLCDILSYGVHEFAKETERDPAFDNPGMAVFAAAGDASTQAKDGLSWPSVSPYVTSVGATLITRDPTTARGWTEVFEDSGWGCSAYEPKPSWQAGASTGCSTRAGADISAASGPMAVYYSGAWHSEGGSSAATPLAAGIFALTGNGATGPSYSYTHTSNFHDITKTKSGGGPGTCGNASCLVGVGWDGPTGNGSPNGQAMATP
jgi:hypothetical protein